jgi:hypothetical protein
MVFDDTILLLVTGSSEKFFLVVTSIHLLSSYY